MDQDIVEDDSVSSSSDEDDKETEGKAAELENQLSENAYLYDVHVELIELYRKMADLNSMRAAYERFHKNFPITPKLWLQWIHDEIQIANSATEKNNILAIFNKAIEDYHSVSLWQEYAQFAIGFCTTDEVRSILEKGLNCVGLHVSQGSLLWDTLREFELAHLSLAEADSPEFTSQLLKVAEIYRRQLSVPLFNMESTYKEWETFIQQLPDDHGIDVKQIEWGYDKAHQLLESYNPYEESLTYAKDENEKYNVYIEYINFIKDPSMKIMLYERAVSELCLNVLLWENYCYYTLKLGDSALKVSERALRNCPWHATLWIARLRMLEIFGKSKEDITACFEEAIKAVSLSDRLSLWLSYLEYVNRTSNDLELIDKICIQAKEQLQTSDLDTKILKLQSRLHAKKGEMTVVRKLWSEIMSNISNKKSAYTWIEYLELEKRFGETKQVRQLYQRAITHCKDWQHYFADEWMMYEREVGTIDDVLKCFQKCKGIVKYNVEDNTSVEYNDSKRKYDDENDKSNQSKKYKSSHVYQTDDITMDERKNRKDKMGKQPVKIQNAPTNIDHEKTIFLSNFVPKINEEVFKEIFPNANEIIIPTDRKGKSRCYAYVIFETTDQMTEALKKDRFPIDGRPLFVSKCEKNPTERQPVFKYASKYESNKLFVRGLPKHYNKEAVEEIFKPYKATDVRLVTKFNGQPKGLAYVDFANDEDAQLALKNTDQMVLDEYTISVAISAPPDKKKEPALLPRQSTRNSKTKLAIPFLPRSVQIKQAEPKDVPSISKTNDEFRKMFLDT